MRVSCKYCGFTHEQGTECSKKPRRQFKYRQGSGKKIDEFRWGRDWKAKRLAIRERDYHCCRVCLELGDRYGTYSGRNVQVNNLSVHHINSLSEDWSGRLTDGNLITLCSYHHQMAEDGKINKKELKQLAENPIRIGIPVRGQNL